MAIVRGKTPSSLIIDSDLKNSKGIFKPAITHLRTILSSEIDLPNDRYKSSRYSFVELMPKMGRFHQIRRHLARTNHPIIGDRPHGCNKQNRLLKKNYNLKKMMLHASEVKFTFNREEYHIKARLPLEFKRMLSILKLE